MFLCQSFNILFNEVKISETTNPLDLVAFPLSYLKYKRLDQNRKVYQ